MRIAIDAHAIGSRLGGNETYVTGLLEALLQADSPHEIIPFFETEEIAEQWRSRFPALETHVYRHHNRWARIGYELTDMTRRLNIDLLHVQYSGPLVNEVPLVTTVHDTTYRIFPEFFPLAERLFLGWSIGQTIKASRRVLTVSEASKRDIQKYHGTDADKIVVTYNGYHKNFYHPRRDHEREQAVLARLGITSPYILSVGNLQPRKNLGTLIRAFELLLQSNPALPHNLVVVGKEAHKFRTFIQGIEKSSTWDRIIFTGFVQDEDLPNLYRGADVFVYPSLYEGFGMPIVEAMACGTPVVTTTGGSLPEIAGEAAILVDPLATESLATDLMVVLGCEQLRSRLRASGLRRVQAFSWKNTAEQTLHAYTSSQH